MGKHIGKQSESRKAQSGFGKWSSLTDGHNAKLFSSYCLGWLHTKKCTVKRIDVY